MTAEKLLKSIQQETSCERLWELKVSATYSTLTSTSHSASPLLSSYILFNIAYGITLKFIIDII